MKNIIIIPTLIGLSIAYAVSITSPVAAEGDKVRKQTLQEVVNDAGTVCEQGIGSDDSVTIVAEFEVDGVDYTVTTVCNPVAAGSGAPQ